jgi:hypothetical protein
VKRLYQARAKWGGNNENNLTALTEESTEERMERFGWGEGM